jgi:hypothetical protein
VRRDIADQNGKPDQRGGEHDGFQDEQQRQANRTEIDGNAIKCRQDHPVEPDRIERKIDPADDGGDARQHLVADDACEHRDDEPRRRQRQRGRHQPAIGRPAKAQDHAVGNPQPDDQKQPPQPPHEGDNDPQEIRIALDQTGSGFDPRLYPLRQCAADQVAGDDDGELIIGPLVQKDRL